MSQNSTKKLAFDELPMHPAPLDKNHYGSTQDGDENDPRTWAPCDLDVANANIGTWCALAPKYALLSDHMVGIALQMGFTDTQLAAWYPGDFVCNKQGNLRFHPERKNSGHPSLAKTGEIHLAYDVLLSGHPIYDCKVEYVGIKLLANLNTPSAENVGVMNSIIDEHYTLRSLIENKEPRSMDAPQNAQVVAGPSNAEDREVSPPKKKRKTEEQGPSAQASVLTEDEQLAQIEMLKDLMRGLVKKGMAAQRGQKHIEWGFESALETLGTIMGDDNEELIKLKTRVARLANAKQSVSAKGDAGEGSSDVKDGRGGDGDEKDGNGVGNP